jgi:branched-chain amino acid transport system substrate-binding protein
MTVDDETDGTTTRGPVDRRSFLAATGVAGVASLAGCTGGAGGGSDAVTVGAIYPLSGNVGEIGKRIQRIVNSAAEEIVNSETDLSPLVLAEGEGLPNLGVEVEVTWADHRGDPGQGRSEAERMIQEENVDMIYGCFHSSVSKTVSQVAAREGIPHVTGESSSPALTERGLDWFWRTGPHDRIYTRNMFEFFDGLNERRDAGLETVAIIHEDTEFGSISARVQESLCEEHGYEIVAGPISYTADSVTSFTSEIDRIKRADPDVLLPTSYLKDAILMAEEMRKLDYFPPLMMAQDSGHSDPGFVEKAELSEHVCTRSTYASDLTETVPELGRFDSFVNEQTDVSFNGIYIRSWGGFMTAMKAVDEAGSTEPEELQAALNGLELDRLETGMPYGCRFGDDGQNELASGVLAQFHDGASGLVWPFELASDDTFVFPAPTWSER